MHKNLPSLSNTFSLFLPFYLASVNLPSISALVTSYLSTYHLSIFSSISTSCTFTSCPSIYHLSNLPSTSTSRISHLSTIILQPHASQADLAITQKKTAKAHQNWASVCLRRFSSNSVGPSSRPRRRDWPLSVETIPDYGAIREKLAQIVSSPAQAPKLCHPVPHTDE